MKPSQVLLAVAAVGVNVASAATPPGSTPQVANTLGIQFGKNNVQPGEMIDQVVADAGQPTLYFPSPKLSNRNLAKHPSPKDKTYIFTMVDLDLPFFALPNTTDFASLVPGIGPNRTTRLHWFEYNVHAVPPHLELKNFSTPIAEYEGPQPPQGDEPHNYVIYLFEQPEGYKPDLAAQKAYLNETSLARMNFSVKALEEQVGKPIAANYFLVQNENNTKSS
ncbi:PEBP-like protein, partial [Aureobasidium melanogenum]